MTFDELQEVIGPQDKSGWHQHKNGGGWVQNSVKIDKSCLVGESAIVFGNAQVSGDAWEKPPLFIVGSKHSLTNSRHGFIKIGCHEKSIAWWQEHFCSIGKKESYTAEEIEEYGHYIDLFAKVAKREGPHADG